ncbi:MAG: hypothetical protein Q8P70_00825 [bacterium]|nr:hypothetical protein [bacterium]
MVAKISQIRKERKKRGNDTLVIGIVCLIILGAVGFLLFQNISMVQRRSALEREAMRLQKELQQMEESRVEMELLAQERDTEEYQEQVLREQGIYKKEGEEVITILPPDVIEKEQQEKPEKERVWWNPLTWVEL